MAPAARSESKHETTHAKIVLHAARILRSKGLRGASVDVVMSEAGLTRGGFYAHFPDKTTLVLAGIDQAFDEVYETWFDEQLPSDPALWTRTAVERYLSERHLEHPEEGCPIPSLAGEIAKDAAPVREAFGANLDIGLRQIAARLGGDPATARARAIALMSTCVGAMTIARAVGDREQALEILLAARSSILGDHTPS